MEKETTTREDYEQLRVEDYEQPRIEDYGTLADLTAGPCGGQLDGLFGVPGGFDIRNCS